MGPPLYPERPLALPKSGTRSPYTPAEQRALVGWIKGLSTAHMRAGATALMGMGFGAGLISREMAAARASWVHEERSGLVLGVEGDRLRRVPVVSRWEWALRRALELAHGGHLFIAGQDPEDSKRVSKFVESLRRGRGPKLSVERLRVTWIIEHLQSGVPLNVLVDAAGVSGEHLGRYASHLEPLEAELADRWLRGNAP